LLVRVGALLRRTTAATQLAAPEDASLVLDPANHGIAGRRAGGSVSLTPTEFRLIAELAAKQGTVVRRAALVSAGWPDGAIVHQNTLDAYVSRIRSKLRKAGRTEQIANVRGVGYVLR
jgi:two-component system response regulator MprA